MTKRCDLLLVGFGGCIVQELNTPNTNITSTGYFALTFIEWEELMFTITSVLPVFSWCWETGEHRGLTECEREEKLLNLQGQVSHSRNERSGKL